MKIGRITMDSFGSECPENWEEIANYLNDLADLLGIPEDNSPEANEQLENIWEKYCNGDLPDAPEAK